MNVTFKIGSYFLGFLFRARVMHCFKFINVKKVNSKFNWSIHGQ